MDESIVVCRCEEVTLGEIKEAIKDGAGTLAGIKRQTRACMGYCQGRTCQPLVKSVLASQTGRPEIEVEPIAVRSPVRPVKMKDMAVEE